MTDLRNQKAAQAIAIVIHLDGSKSSFQRMKVAFYSPHLCLRGTSVAMFGYAFHNQRLLNNQSVIIHHRIHPHNHPSPIQTFRNHFPVIAIDGVHQLDQTLAAVGADAVYIIKGGNKDGILATACRNLIHATAMARPDQLHGERFAYVSEWMSHHLSHGTIPFVPHMIDLPDVRDDMRDELGIPKDATVFGRTGGPDTWNLDFANAAVAEALAKRGDIFFIFQNTIPFISHPRVIHIPNTWDSNFKVRFINSCDAMVHCRGEGESFGLACGEFSVRNKPIITWFGSPERNHIFVLGEKGIYYRDKNELVNILCNFKNDDTVDWNCYRKYEPANVMPIFKRVFLD